MSHPATDFDPPGEAHLSRPRWLVAIGWAFAGTLCASAGWAVVLILTLNLLEITPSVESLKGVAIYELPLLILGGD